MQGGLQDPSMLSANRMKVSGWFSDGKPQQQNTGATATRSAAGENEGKQTSKISKVRGILEDIEIIIKKELYFLDQHKENGPGEKSGQPDAKLGRNYVTISPDLWEQYGSEEIVAPSNMRWDSARGAWDGNERDPGLKRLRRDPNFISPHDIDPTDLHTVGTSNMKWNPVTMKWEGNTKDLDRFTSPSPRKSNIPLIRDYVDVHVQHGRMESGMVLNTNTMKWEGNWDEGDVFPDFFVDEEESKHKLTVEFVLSEQDKKRMMQSADNHNVELKGWLVKEANEDSKAHYQFVRRAGIMHTIRQVRQLAGLEPMRPKFHPRPQAQQKRFRGQEKKSVDLNKYKEVSNEDLWDFDEELNVDAAKNLTPQKAENASGNKNMTLITPDAMNIDTPSSLNASQDEELDDWGDAFEGDDFDAVLKVPQPLKQKPIEPLPAAEVEEWDDIEFPPHFSEGALAKFDGNDSDSSSVLSRDDASSSTDDFENFESDLEIPDEPLTLTTGAKKATAKISWKEPQNVWPQA